MKKAEPTKSETMPGEDIVKTSKRLVLLALLTWVTAWAQVTIQNQKIVEKKARYAISIDYPQLSLPGNPKGQQRLNALLKQDAQRMAEEFRAEYQEAETDLPNDISPGILESEYTLEYKTDRLLVLSQHGYLDTGGAHGMPLMEALILDLQAGKRFYLKDFFKPQSPYLKLLSDYSRKALARKNKDKLLSDPDWIQRGTTPTADNFSIVFPTRKGLLIRFPPYQVAPFASGMQEVLVPYSALATGLDSAGPLGQYAR